MIERHEPKTVTTDKIPAIHHSISKAFFQLRISVGPFHTSEVSNNGFISAQLYLFSEVALPDSCLFQAHIRVLLPKRSKQKKSLSGCVKKQWCVMVSEQAVLLDLPATHKDKQAVSSEQEFKSSCVAVFSNLISYKNFMDDKLVSAPYLSINLFVREL